MATKNKGQIKIVVDAMGGDYAPQETVAGAIQAARELEVAIVLAGDKEVVQEELRKYDTSNLPVSVVNAPQTIREGDSPIEALRLKPDASILVATRMVKEGKADAVVSMGYTGAVLISAIEILGKLAGVKRPIIGGFICGLAPDTMVFDMGANADCRPRDLLNFAAIGSVVCQKILHITNPTVALLSNGAEEGKGNLLVKKAYPAFKNSHLNFIGNVEGKDIPYGKANVIICDGFVGNILLKFCEGLGEAVIKYLEENLKGQLPQTQVETISQDLFTLTHTAGRGAPIFGVAGVAVTGHGCSRATEIAGAIRTARMAVETNLVDEIKAELHRVQGE
jgi:glycerol-3-phosphate acyltransferase PlsX